MTTNPTREQLARFDTESGGVISIILVRALDAFALLAAKEAGDIRATHIALCLEEVLGAPRQLCMLCERRAAPDLPVIGLLLPHRDDPKSALGFGFCESHSRLSNDRLVPLVAKRIGNNVRLLDPREFGPAGRA